MSTTPTQALPDCWGHRGASARFPENTLASFEAAIRYGAEGIESDVHVTLDGVVLMFHDPALDRTTDTTGLIREQNWHGEKGLNEVRTRKEPHQPIPTFNETVVLLMQPENQHVKFNVDVKVQNNPDRLFKLMHEVIAAQPDWETVLAPRILLGLWHPTFLPAAKERLPYCRRSFIGRNLANARNYFWDDCDTFSVNFGALTSADGEKFRKECKVAGKKVLVWTVNEPEHMMETVRWGVDAIITDVPKIWLDLRAALSSDYEKTRSQYGRGFLWTSWMFYLPVQMLMNNLESKYLEKSAGPFTRSARIETVG